MVDVSVIQKSQDVLETSAELNLSLKCRILFTRLNLTWSKNKKQQSGKVVTLDEAKQSTCLNVLFGDFGLIRKHVRPFDLLFLHKHRAPRGCDSANCPQSPTQLS